MTIRQPIVTVCGHVDHGKTSILDSLRGTCVQGGEAGGITQKISFTSYPLSQIKKSCSLIEKSGINLEIPGFLFIDTPGHAAFSNLRKRGGSLADLAILVVDINEGIKPQTSEVLQIMKINKTPFIIALNKIDKISGWNKRNENLRENIETQPINVKQNFDEKLFTLMGSLNSYGFDADLFYNINDFTKKIALVPCSARTKEGLQELMMVLCGLSQKYLTEKLKLGKEAKGVVLEVKKEKSIHYVEAILYDGELLRTNEIAIANFLNQDEPIITKIRILEEIEPMCAKFKAKEKTIASTGIRMQLVDKIEVLPGMPFVLFKENKEEIKESFKKQIGENIKTDKKGIIAKADSLGSLEALLVLLKQNNIPVVKAGIGNVNKTDIINAKANLENDEINSIISGFNVEIDEDAKLFLENEKRVKIVKNDIIYKLIEDLIKIREEKRRDVEKKRLMELTTICKLTILKQHVFRNSNPAIFGVRIEGGKLMSGLSLIDNDGIKIARVKNIQSENKSVNEATESMEIAMSLPGVNFERQLKDKTSLYSEIGESQFKKFKKNKDLLSEKEIKILSEIAEIKRREKPEWGM
jgi:translation initiation factor 5B